MGKRISVVLSESVEWIYGAIEQEQKEQNRPSFNNMVETILLNYVKSAGYVPVEDDLITDEDVRSVNETMQKIASQAPPIQAQISEVISKAINKDCTGLRFGKLLVKERIQTGDSVYYVCACDCGDSELFSEKKLISGEAVDCGHCDDKIEVEKPVNPEMVKYIERLKKNAPKPSDTAPDIENNLVTPCEENVSNA